MEGNDERSSENTSQDPAPASNVVEIDVILSPRINFASAQNAVPIIQSLTLRNRGEACLDNLRLTLDPQPPFLRKKTWVVDRLGADTKIAVTNRELKLDLKFLDGLNEAEHGQLTFTLFSGESTVAENVQPVQILARDEWGGVGAMSQILAAFISPNDPAIPALIKEASRILEAAGHSGALDGYQSKDPRRAWMLAASIWSAATALNLSYAEPPKSFEKAGQKVRGPGQIVGEGLATCLDTSLLLAAALEAAGLNPIVVFVEGHAFAGVWLQDMTFNGTVEPDPTELRKAIAARELLVFETTLLCQRPAIGYKQAIAEAEKRLTEEEEHLFDRAVDVCRCRAANIHPLSTAREAKTADTTEEASAAAALPGLPDFGVLPGELIDEVPQDAQGRVKRWERKLLDLSLRNKLLNFTKTKQSIPLLCPDVPKLEDMLAESTRFSIISLPDENPTGNRDRELHRQQHGEDIETGYAREALDRKELCAPITGHDLTGRLTTLFRKAKSDLSEGGTNTLFLAVGFLKWKKTPKDTRVYRSPLLLLPVKLTRQSARSGYRVSHHEDDVRFNATLLEFLKRDFGLEVPGLLGDLPRDESGINVPAVFEMMRAAVRTTPGFEVSEEAAIGTFSFTKFLMWKDLVDRTDELRKNRLVKHLIDSAEGEKFEGAGGDNGQGFPKPRDIDRLAPKDLLTPLPADSSQLVAVVAAQRDHDFIIIGPPGTGKSQTIANIIAHCLAKGKTVLFVAEKAAALDVVYRRLRHYGLGDACLELHSNKTDRARVLKQLGAAWDRSAEDAGQEWVRVTGNLEVKRDRLNAYVDALHAKGFHGMSVFEAIGRAARFDGPLVSLSYDQPDAHDRESFAALREIARKAGITWAQARLGNALASVTATEWSFAWEREFLQRAEAVGIAAEAARERACELAAALGLPGEASVSSPRRDLLERFAEAAARVGDGDFTLALGANLATAEARVEPVTALLKTIADAKARLAGDYEEAEIKTIPIRQIDLEWRQASAKVWPLSDFAKRGVTRFLRTYAKPAGRAPDPAKDIAQLARLQSDLRELDQDPLAAVPVFVGSSTRPKVLQEWVAAAGEYRTVADDIRRLGGSEHALEAVARSGGSASEPARTSHSFAAAMTELRQAVATHAAHAGGAPEIKGLFDLKAAFDAMLAQRAHLANRTHWAKLRQAATARGLTPLLDALEEERIETAASEEVFIASYVNWWLPLALDRSEALRGFLTWKHEDLRSTFIELDETAQRLASTQIRLALTHSLPGKDSVPQRSELGTLRHQLGLIRPSMAIRKLIHQMPTTFTKLAPCVLMSPLSVAQYLPAGHQGFDLVIFDEASQITTWDAVGVIARAKQAIICGDPKQLPPTNFFGRTERDDENIEFYERDMPSILDEVKAAGIPVHRLNWHYRSRDEALIAFSNRNYYGGKLVTFPAPKTSTEAVKLHRLDGIFGRGKSRTNRVEAEAIVALLVERMGAELEEPPEDRKTFGVITFNRQQQDLILDLLDEARRQNPQLEWFFGDDREEPTIVKNLENIQGDERDIMMFSITFGPDDAGRITMNFGALNPQGGEKRLNVAVTRSRDELHVFASLDSDQIDLRRTNSTGVADLKQFLDYAERGSVALVAADKGSMGPAESPFEEAVAKALDGRGWEVRTQIGVSGFRIDLGIVHPGRAGAYLAGIECDGYTYHRSATARDRDRIRQNILTNLGWRILRVWSTDWFRNAGETTERLHDALKAVLEEDRARRARTGDAEESGDEPADSTDAQTTLIARGAGEKPAASSRESTEALSDPEDDTAPASEATPPAETMAQDEDTLGGRPNDSMGADTSESEVDPLADEVGQRGSPDYEKPDPDRFHDDNYTPRLKALISGVVAAEGPLPLDLLARAVAREHGWQRAGSRIKQRVLYCLGDNELHDDRNGRFVWSPGSYRDEIPFRHELDRGLRERPFAEFMGALRANPDVLDAEDPADAFARRIGVRRLSAKARSWMDECLSAWH